MRRGAYRGRLPLLVGHSPAEVFAPNVPAALERLDAMLKRCTCGGTGETRERLVAFGMSWLRLLPRVRPVPIGAAYLVTTCPKCRELRQVVEILRQVL